MGAALLAKAKGESPFVSDLSVISNSVKKELEAKQIPFEEGKHTAEIILAGNQIIKSPGIPDSAPLIQDALRKGIPVINELEYASRFTRAKIIAITGTNGKTTTTLLTHHLLKNAGVKVGLAGNVGHSLARQVINDDKDIYVIEVSSFQLDGMFNFKADVGVLLNITPDHLDRYEYDIQNYINSKFRILQNMTADDAFIYWADDAVIGKELSNRDVAATINPISLNQREGCSHLNGNQLIIKTENENLEIPISSLPLIGKHNILNAMASIIAAAKVGINKEQIINGLKSFRNAPHRLEKVAELNGVQYINDSKATNVDAVYYALDGIEAPIIWIAGGVDKGNDYKLIEGLVKSRVKSLICLGTDNQPLTSFFDDKLETISETEDIAEAIAIAKNISNEGDTVLLSPACASFDLFKNYEHRGDRFREEVLKLKPENGNKKEVPL